jgi:hypothetical protein
VIRGLDNFIVVDDENVLMIYSKLEEQETKRVSKEMVALSDLNILNTSQGLPNEDKPFLLLVIVVDLLIIQSAYLLHSNQLKSVTLL